MTLHEWWMITRAIVVGTFGGMVLFSGLLLAILHDKCFRRFRKWIAKKLVNFMEEGKKA